MPPDRPLRADTGGNADEKDEIEVRAPAESGGDAGGKGNSSNGEDGNGGGESRRSRSVCRWRNRPSTERTSL